VINQDHLAGQYKINMNTNSYSEGFYLVKMESLQGVCSQKLCVMSK